MPSFRMRRDERFRREASGPIRVPPAPAVRTEGCQQVIAGRLRLLLERHPFLRHIAYQADRLGLQKVRSYLRRSVRLIVDSAGHVHYTSPGGHIVFADSSDRRGHRLAQSGALDHGLVRCWRQLVADLDPTLVLDVGANYGEVAFSCSSYGDADVHLFEPNPRVAACVERSLAENKLDWHLHQVAVGREQGTAFLTLDERGSGLGFVSKEPQGERDTFQTRVTTLDAALASRTADRLLMKVDVEGAEMEVLLGASQLMRRCASVSILMEFCHFTPEVADAVFERFDCSVVDRAALTYHRIAREDLDPLIASRPPQLLKDLLLRPRPGANLVQSESSQERMPRRPTRFGSR